nr:hypothetical protein [Tanacetum cinerariifolium]
MARNKEMYIISSHIKKIFANMRRIGAGFSGAITPFFDTMMIQAAEDIGDTPVESVKHPLLINHLLQSPKRNTSQGGNRGRSLQEQVLDLQKAKDAQAKEGRTKDDEMFEVDDLAREEVVMDTTAVTTAVDKVSVAPTTDVTKDEITMAQALAALKSTKPKVVIQEQEVSTTIPVAATKVTTTVQTPRAKGIVFHEQKQSHIPIVSSSKDKGKAKMIEPEVPIKKKDQIRIDEEYARQEATSLRRAQQDEEANIS